MNEPEATPSSRDYQHFDWLWQDDGLIRADLFSVERLEQHAASLALAQRATAHPHRGRVLDDRLRDNGSRLFEAYRTLTSAAGDDRAVTPAAEWFTDNFHVVEAQIRQIHQDLPPRYYQQLPKLSDGSFAGYPRVFGMAWACIAHSDSRFDAEHLRRFVAAYQRVQVLTIGELWAVAITLRIALIENLRRAVDRILTGRIARDAADELADRLLGTGACDGEAEALVRDQEGGTALSPAFVVQLVKRLRDHDPEQTPAVRWLDRLLASFDESADELVYDEHQRQGAANVTVRNIVTSLRLIADTNWPDFFESVSPVDALLRGASDFDAMDFATRNLYRSAIEDLARGSGRCELDIARAALAAARQHAGSAQPERDPGYYLIARGRRELERSVGYRAALRDRPARWGASMGPGAYVCAVLAMSALVLALPLALLVSRGTAGGTLWLFSLLGIVPAIDAAVALVNRGATRSISATMLPALALPMGVPPPLRTMVVVPALLTTPAALEALVRRLEVHFLASRPGEIHFALLTDWTDALAAHAADDELLLDLAASGIARLNAAHAAGAAGPRFYLLHRRRRWSEGQSCWMGWERKRGKLHELNRLLRGATDTSFMAICGVPPAVPPSVRYVVTLDTDTRLPREAVVRLVGKMAHPLNEPRYDATRRRVVDGYAVLQPRVTASLPVGREGSLFQRVFSSMTGINAYDTAAADVYQDLFGAGSYAGKGIYDVDAFETVLADRVPEGSLLSHDLFEGTFARSGLVSDIEVVEEFPSDYDAAAARNHRWARGDWQLLPWIFGRADPARLGQHSLPLLAIWKMLDNLRRTLSAPACLAALVCGWLLPGNLALIWTLFVVGGIALPSLLPALSILLPQRPGIRLRSHLHALADDLWLALLQIGLVVSFLPHQALLMGDAIFRTLYRLFISHRNLLEWVTAAQTQRRVRPGFGKTLLHVGGGAMFSVTVLVLLASSAMPAWWLAAPFLLVWAVSPLLSRWISLSPRVAGRVPASTADSRGLRLVARRTWRYFEAFVTTDDNWLPPDNFQEDPVPVVAHRTSPTNLGLYLLSVVGARDFGWIGTVEAVERLDGTLATMRRMERHRGHFFNWYDTRELRPLAPRYVSSVDSGNLAAHLITLANACSEWRRAAPNGAPPCAGVDDALRLARAAVDGEDPLAAFRPMPCGSVAAALDDFMNVLALQSAAPNNPAAHCAALTMRATALTAAARALTAEFPAPQASELQYWSEAAMRTVASWRRDIEQTGDARAALQRRLVALETTARAMAFEMNFGFLLDTQRNLLSIGYRVDEGALDPSCYDLLASEARLASFFAITKNDVPTRHWFRLGRAVTAVGHGAALLSWSGSMFEYLMPSLVMRAPAGSLLERTSRLIVRRQIAYAQARQVPWGISESAYNARDLELTYQYSNFGVPDLGLKRGLAQSIVIAPYATALAAMVDPHAASVNFARLTQLGACGRYGYCESIDYTRTRLPEGATFVIVRAYMAHHQGMTIVALANVLFDGCMRTRFHAEPGVQASELLLQERTPRDVGAAPAAVDAAAAVRSPRSDRVPVRRVTRVQTETPQTHLLSNGRYAVMITSAGAGYSRWRDLSITRWREDATCDADGSFILLRDVDSGEIWSATFQPCGVEPDGYEASFTEDRAVFVRRDGTLTTSLQVVVSPEDDAEVRRVSIANGSRTTREIEVTSCCELVLAPSAADVAHPAFSKLFVQTDYLPALGALIANRRARAPGDAEIWVAHQVIVEGDAPGPLEYETDRVQLLGRCNDLRTAAAFRSTQPLSNTVGTVLDPVFALRRRVRIPPGTAVHLAYWTVVASTQASVSDLLDKHHDANAYSRAATLAWTQAQAQLLHLGATADEADLFQRLAGHVLYAGPALRAPSEVIRRGCGPRDALWAHGISGDRPIVLLRIGDVEDLAVARQLLRAHEYWRLKQLAVDLVILNERASSYVQDLQDALETAVRMSQARPRIGNVGVHGGVFVLRTDLILAHTRGVLNAVARLVFVAQRGSLDAQLKRLAAPPRSPPPAPRAVPAAPPRRPAAPEALEFDNGVGGFAEEGHEYVIRLSGNLPTPAPWINVISNARFGCQIAAEGSGYTWSENSRENQLTPWSNDPVTDPPGEALYVRDEASGACWSPTLSPLADDAARYTVRHGHGYSRFEHAAVDLTLALDVFVPLEDPIKICRLSLRDHSGRPRRLAITAYVDWVLGSARSASSAFIVTSIDPVTGALFATNPMNPMYPARVAFMDLGGTQTEWTGDRREFIGRHGRLAAPAALAAMLSKRTGAGLDPCGALRTCIEFDAHGRHELVFLLGEAACEADAQTLLLRYREADLDAVLTSVKTHWRRTLGTLQVRTPDRALDLLLNGWLLYQTLACRLWARGAFYQASGAYGFRDQLQDVMALVTARPALARTHLLRAAARQFLQGDVQHWWLPATGAGVRTRISDDRLWLAYVTEHYLRRTGDGTVLDVAVPFLDAPPLAPGTHEAFEVPMVTSETASLFEHCARALDASLALGPHRLPLIGTGDWNDSMNRVGPEGRGESVWLGWFLYATLTAFAPHARERDPARAARWLTHAAVLREALAREAWDGAWYRRGYFDDGTALGTALADECRIDSIAQSWSVLSGAADPLRSAQAMAAVQRELLLPEARLALLFTPPFAHTAQDPGYVKAYPPGLRENGGQYTHAAAWSVMALAALGRGDDAAALFALINPVNIASSAAGMQRYRVEPYVVAADVYSVAPHVGRGGWSWYTGAAGWLYRAGIEAILGFRQEGASFVMSPCIPAHWSHFELVFAYHDARYEIRVENPAGVNRGIAAVEIDGLPISPVHGRIPLCADARTHRVLVTLGTSAPR